MPSKAIYHSVSQNIATIFNEFETVLLDEMSENCTFVHMMLYQISTIGFYMPMMARCHRNILL